MMLSIDGNTYEEVFTAISRDERYDSEEQAGASAIAQDMRTLRMYHSERDAAYNRFRETDWMTADHHYEDWCDSHPKPAEDSYHCHNPAQDMTIFDVAGTKLRFVVKPYTTGNAMNVGVSRREGSEK